MSPKQILNALTVSSEDLIQINPLKKKKKRKIQFYLNREAVSEDLARWTSAGKETEGNGALESCEQDPGSRDP